MKNEQFWGSYQGLVWFSRDFAANAEYYGFNSISAMFRAYFQTTIFDAKIQRFSKTPTKKLHNVMKEMNSKYQFVKMIEHKIKDDEENQSDIYVWDNCLILTYHTEKKYVIHIYSTDKQMIEDFVATSKKNGFSKEIPEPVLYVLAQTEKGISYHNIDNVGVKFSEDHYNHGIVNQKQRVTKDFKAKEPTGRIVLVEGSPGTGKTYFIRGLINESPECVYVFIPPDLVSALTGPTLISVLTELSDRKQTIVLVIEDGDHCLVPRSIDNISAISALLNITDGIIGSALDIRAVITTNAKTTNIDTAIMRPGRLSEHISIEALTDDKAQTLYKKLTKDENAVYMSPDTTLAAIYATSKDIKYVNKNVEQKVKKTGKMGF